jgi:hypothetical protein
MRATPLRIAVAAVAVLLVCAASASATTEQVTILSPANGDGTYAVKGQQIPGYGFGDGQWFATDADDDGRIDLVHRWSQGVNTWLSKGDGTYNVQQFQAWTGYGYQQGTWFTADVDGDGRTDLIHRWDEGINSWISDGDGTFTIKGQQAQLGYGYGQGSWSAADINGDSNIDVIHRWDEGANSWLSRGDGTYAITAHQAQVGYGYGAWLVGLPAATLLSAARPKLQGRATITGPLVAGATLTCSHGARSGHPTTITYIWLRDRVVIVGATSQSYATTAADAGRELGCRVTAQCKAGVSLRSGARVNIVTGART